MDICFGYSFCICSVCINVYSCLSLLWVVDDCLFVGMIISPALQFLLILFLPKNSKWGDCRSFNIGTIHVKNKMHVVSPSNPSALDVVIGDDSANCVTHIPLVVCVSHVDRTKGKAYLTFVGPQVHKGNFPQIKYRYSANQESISSVLIKE